MRVLCIDGSGSMGLLKTGVVYNAIPGVYGHYVIDGVVSQWFCSRFVIVDFKTYLKKL